MKKTWEKNLAILMKEYRSFLRTSESQHDFVEKEIEMKEEGCAGVKCHLCEKSGWKCKEVVYVKQNGEVEEISRCYKSCSNDLKFKEFCYTTAICHEIHHNIMNLKSKIRRERN